MKHVARTSVSLVLALVFLVGALGVSFSPAHAENPPEWAMTADDFQFHDYAGVVDLEGSHMVSEPNGPARYFLMQGEVMGLAGNTWLNGNVNAGTTFRPSGIPTNQFYTLYWYAYMIGLTPETSCGMTINGLGYNGCGTEFSGTLPDQSAMYWTGFAFYASHGPGAAQVDMDFVLVVSLDPNPAIPTHIPALVYLDDSEWTLGGETAWEHNLIPYFEDMNRILAKSTLKRLDWNGHVEHSSAVPFDQGTQNCNYFGQDGVKIWFTGKVGSRSWGRDCQGYGTIMVNTNYIYNDIVPNRDEAGGWQSDEPFNQYWWTVSTVLHELNHTFGAFTIEGYFYKDWTDDTHESPLTSIHYENTDDKWWNGEFGDTYKHTDMRLDPGSDLIPMTGRNHNFEEELKNYKLSRLTSEFINTGTYRDQFQIGGAFPPPLYGTVNVVDRMTYDFKHLHISQLDESGAGKPNIRIKAWRMGIAMEFAGVTSWAGQATTDGNGWATIDLPLCLTHPANPVGSCNAILLKSYQVAPNGVEIPYGRAQIVDIYNLQLKVFALGAPITDYYATLLRPIFASTDVNIGGVNKGSYDVSSNTVATQSYASLNDGPVQATVQEGVPVAVSKRVLSGSSYSETMGLPASQVDTTFWFPIYNNVGYDTQLRIGNVSSSTATVHLYVGGAELTGSPFTIAAGDGYRQNFAGINNGPLKVVSDVPIVASERVLYGTSYSEMMGLPGRLADTTVYFPAYNNVGYDTQLRVGNTGASSATVHVYVAGAELTGSPFTIAAGSYMKQNFAGINSGPAKVVSDQPIVVTERVLMGSSFSEVMGLPASQLSTTAWFPVYDNSAPSTLESQLRIANVGTSQATIHVLVAGAEVTGSPFNLAAGAAIRPTFSANGGPMEISSDQPIVATNRLLYSVGGVGTSISEVMGLPALDGAYWFPWYNNVGLDAQLRIARP